MNRTSKCFALAAGIVTLAAAGPALAVPGYSTAHLNLRTGPGTQYPVVGTMEYNVRSDITGCLADWSWCSITVAGLSGFLIRQYADRIDAERIDGRCRIRMHFDH